MKDFSPKNILIQIYAEEPSQSLLDYGCALAKASGGKLTLVDVIPDSSWPARFMTSGIERAVENVTHAKGKLLKAVAEKVAESGVEVQTRVLNAPSSASIVREVVEQNHDLVIRETKSQASRRLGFFGTTATRLLRRCPCPVLLLKPEQNWPPQDVTAAVDVSSEDDVHLALNSRILDAAQFFCQGENPIGICSAWKVFGETALKGHMDAQEFEDLAEKAEQDCRDRLTNLVKDYGLNLESKNVHLLHGDPHQSIPEFINSGQTELLVMGTVARAGLLGFFIGNTAEQILGQIECSVLAIKPAEFDPLTSIREAK